MFNFFVFFAAFLAVWGVALAVVAVGVLTASLVGVVSPPTAAVFLAAVGIGLSALADSRRQGVGVLFWILILGSGAAAAAVGPGALGLWGLVVGGLVAGILFAIPATFSQAARSALLVLLVAQLLLSLALVAREMGWVPGGWAVLAALLLVGLSILLGAGSYRPREIRRARRLAARWAMLAAAVILLWQPVIVPVGQWLSAIVQKAEEAFTNSPVGSWYRIVSARAERAEIGEASKTEALRGLQDELQHSHKERWRKAIQEIPSLPLAQEKWRDIGIPRQADP